MHERAVWIVQSVTSIPDSTRRTGGLFRGSITSRAIREIPYAHQVKKQLVLEKGEPISDVILSCSRKLERTKETRGDPSAAASQ